MKHFFTSILLIANLSASINNIDSFEADFTQSITDEKNKVLTYSGHLIASKPQNALWRYDRPVQKDVYINSFQVTIVEPEIEQVIIRKIESSFNLFNMLKNTKQIDENTYEASYKNLTFKIIKKDDSIESISYIDEFENSVKIVFKNQVSNKKIEEKVFTPRYPLEFDIIRD